jgi:hypothetical protein
MSIVPLNLLDDILHRFFTDLEQMNCIFSWEMLILPNLVFKDRFDCNCGILIIQDFWKYKISTNSWTEIPVPSFVKNRVHGSAAVTHHKFVAPFGDINDLKECKVNQISGGQNPTNETVVYYFTGPKAGTWEIEIIQNAKQLKRVCYDYQDEGNDRVLYIYDGTNYHCESKDGPFYAGNSYPEYNTDMLTLKV